MQFHSRYKQLLSQPQISNGRKATDTQSLGVGTNDKQVAFWVKCNGTYRLNILQWRHRHKPWLAAWTVSTLYQSPHHTTPQLAPARYASTSKICTLCPVWSVAATKQRNIHGQVNSTTFWYFSPLPTVSESSLRHSDKFQLQFMTTNISSRPSRK